MREAALPAIPGVLGWLKARERRVLLFTVVAQLLILLSMIAAQAAPLITGQTVLVRVVPVDPRDMFRGEYVRLSYAFSRIPPEGVEGISEAQRRGASKEGRTVYVPLVPDSDRVHMRAEKVTVVKPARSPFLKGQMSRWGQLEFGIESYFLQEGTGRVYEQAVHDRKLTAELAVSSDGQAALRSLKIE